MTKKIKNSSTAAKFIDITIDFEDVKSIRCVLQATSEEKYIDIIDGKLRLQQGRIYYLPVKEIVDSDKYFIKMLSEMADKLKVLFVKDNMAAVVPYRYHLTIDDKVKLCELRTGLYDTIE